MAKLGTVAANIETATRSGEFVAIARLLLKAKGGMSHAAAMAEAEGYSSRVVGVLKAAVSAGGLAGPWGSQLAEYPGVVAAFLDSLRNISAFDMMLPAMKRIPLRSRISITTIGATGAVVPGGHVVPISNFALEGGQLEETAAMAMMVVTDELLKHGSGAGDLFARELRNAVAVVTDQEFIRLITEGVSPAASNGSSAAAVLADLFAAFNAISTDQNSSLYVLTSPIIAKAWATKTTSIGSRAFPEMTPKGGEMAGVPCLVSDGVSAGQIIVADANAIAAGGGGIDIDTSRQADIQMDTAPHSPPLAASVLQSLWQSGTNALKALRYFGAERLRDDAVAVIDGVSYAGNSPE